MNIRKAAKVDLDNVLYITSKTIEEVYPRYYPRGAVEFFLSHHSRDNILCDIENDRVYILEVDNMLTGTVTIKGSEICRLFVLPSYHRLGYGRALMDFAENYISKSFMKIQLDASLPAKGIYSNRGYKEVESHSILTKSGDYLCYDVMEKIISSNLQVHLL
ncbi:MAG: GNAT family N-acetyltransferase [Peptostreptococcaceae bacterium]